jgi:hypothetical protein
MLYQIEMGVVRLSSSTPAQGDPLTIIGFGLTSEGGQNSNELLEAQVSYVDSEDCASIFENENEVIPDVMLCAAGSGVDA